MQTLPTDYSHQQLVDALSAEYEFLCHDDYDPDVDMSPADYRADISKLSHSELVSRTDTDDIFTLSDFMSTYGWCLPPAFTVGCRLHVYLFTLYFTYTCSPINHLHSSVTSAQIFFAARVTYSLRMVSSTRITMYHVVHCLTLSSISLCLLGSGSTVIV